jgi:hypothetical protein
MLATTPDWLARRGELRPRGDGRSWVVYFDGRPQYVLTPVPAQGQHGCEVMQTNNGKLLDRGSTHPTVEDAIRGGLEDLRQALGW